VWALSRSRRKERWHKTSTRTLSSQQSQDVLGIRNPGAPNLPERCWIVGTNIRGKLFMHLRWEYIHIGRTCILSCRHSEVESHSVLHQKDFSGHKITTLTYRARGFCRFVRLQSLHFCYYIDGRFWTKLLLPAGNGRQHPGAIRNSSEKSNIGIHFWWRVPLVALLKYGKGGYLTWRFIFCD
jgi:hypothetical protein